MRIDSSGRVLIGVGSASHASGNTDDLCVGNNDSSNEHGITIGSNVAGGIRWADTASGSAAVLEYQHNNTRYAIASEGSTRLVIDADGIKFQGDTAAANGLDDYEEGTWSPGGSWDNTVGVYTKIGRVVHAAFRVRVNLSLIHI